MGDLENTKEGTTEELVALRRQVAALKSAEKTLLESNRRMQTLLDTVPLGVADCDVTGVITFANPVYQRMLGYAEDEMLGKPLTEMLALDRKEIPCRIT
jgi:PAS domain-containing protein